MRMLLWENTLFALLKEYDNNVQRIPSVERCSELLEPNLIEPLVTVTSQWEPEVGKDREKPRNYAWAVDGKLNSHPNPVKKGIC